MKYDVDLHILHFLCDESKKPDMADEMYLRLWKLRIHVERLNDSFGKLYSTAEYLAVDKVTEFRRDGVFQRVYTHSSTII
jgi:hypothetical protein